MMSPVASATTVTGVGDPDAPLVINPGSTAGAVATDDLNLYSGTVVGWISDMPDTRNVGKVTIGAFKRGPGCSSSAPVTLTVREGPDTALSDGEQVSQSLTPVDFTSGASNLEFTMEPFTMRAGHSYRFVIYHGSTTCLVGTRYTWDHNESHVTGGSAELCSGYPVEYSKWRFYHVQNEWDAPTCYLQSIGYFDASMPTGWLQLGAYGFGLTVDSFIVDVNGPESDICADGAEGVYWRQMPVEPQLHQEWVCKFPMFSAPGTTEDDGWYFTGDWDHTGGTPRDMYMKFEAPDVQGLLDAYEPSMEFNDGEDFYPQAASAFTNNSAEGNSPYDPANANRLMSGTTVLAAGGSPGGGTLPPALTLDTLGASYSLTGNPAASSSDHIDAHGSDASTAQVDATYQALLQGDEYGTVYGRFVQDSDDHGVWLQYWDFYYYNSYDFLGFGLHEGDWEMQQVHLSPNLVNQDMEPDEVTFSIHNTAGRGCAWQDLGFTTEDHPMVFPGRGSHASYPDAGVSTIEVDGAPSPADDTHHGDGLEQLPPVTILPSAGWNDWPGRWGSSTGDEGSPVSPSYQGTKWDHPSEFDANSDHDSCFAD